DGAGAPRASGPLAGSLAEGRRWLAEPLPIHAAEPGWWEQWYVWTAVAAVLAAGVGAALALALGQGDAPPPLVLVVDPRALPSAGVD
ncbi:MAG: hypothetical protein KF729_06225, partial [Sandaracinaceae bacterium]|nr:hypothetical protein [Sandaracinaceae bacterium]